MEIPELCRTHTGGGGLLRCPVVSLTASPSRTKIPNVRPPSLLSTAMADDAASQSSGQLKARRMWRAASNGIFGS